MNLPHLQSARTFLLALSCMFSCMFIAPVTAGAEIETASISQPLFAVDDIAEITISADFSRINREKDRDEEYRGSLSYITDAGDPVLLEVKFSVRGNNRLQNCRFAPLWVDLDKDAVAGTLFEGQNRLKLVLPCESTSRHEEYLARELLAYRLFRLLDPGGFAVRQVRLEYVDPGRGSTSELPGFFIEHHSRLADRTGMSEAEVASIRADQLDPFQAELVDQFMFMIGNTDYSLITSADEDCCHNSKLLQSGEHYFPVPYDFDSSGLVDASYSTPNASLPIRRNTQRLYRGYCRDRNVVEEVLRFMQSKKDMLLSEASRTESLSQRSAERVTAYLEGYFDIISSQRTLERDIYGDCR